MLKTKTLAQLLLVLLAGLLASCSPTYDLLEAKARPEASSTSAAPAAAGVTAAEVATGAGIQPAPAGLSRSEQKRYYQAQLDAQRQATPAKVKNSNNTTNTYKQQIHNVSLAALVVLAVVAALLGGVVGFLIRGRLLV